MLTALAASLVFNSSSALPALLVGRVLTGLALGAAVATATAHLADLDGGPSAPATLRAQIVATIATVGGLASGPLLAGILAQYVTGDPQIIFVMFTALLTLAVAATSLVPEGRPIPVARPEYHPQRLAVPHSARREFTAALVGDFLAFTVFGLFARPRLRVPDRDPPPTVAGPRRPDSLRSRSASVCSRRSSRSGGRFAGCSASASRC